MSEPKDTSWIQPSDFEKIAVAIEVINTTTQMPVPMDSHIELTEIDANSLTLTLPIRSCAQGHMLSIQIHVSGAVMIEIELTAKVTEELLLDKNSKAVSLLIYQTNDALWKQVIAAIQAGQKTINQTVKNIRE